MRRIIQYIAVVVALIGLADSIYLTIHHYTDEPVPCGITGQGCEMVLSSTYSEIAGFPLASFGAVAYFVAFSLALLSAFGNSMTWKLFGALATVMAVFSGWLIYVQAYYIGAFCQYCLLSAGTSFTLFILFLISLATRNKWLAAE
jgi:uncharacterized membrane protein